MNIRVGLSSWIIEDGNYYDFHAGQEARFALEFAGALEPSAVVAKPSLSHLEGPIHHGTGTVVFTHPNVWVCDFGIAAYRMEAPPDWAQVGMGVRGELYIGIDPYFYMDDLCSLPGMPELRHSFRIRSISVETTPWLSHVDEEGRRVQYRDPTATRTFREVANTSARLEGIGSAEYVMDCELLFAAV